MTADRHPRLRETRAALGRLLKNPSGAVGLILLLIFGGVALFAPLLAPPDRPHDPYRMPRAGYATTPRPPSADHPFGTTSGQYDIRHGVIWGTRTAFTIGFFVVGISALVGGILGLVSGYAGGMVDEVLMRLTDVVFAVPGLVLAMAIVVARGRGLDSVMLALALIGWRNYVRVMRAGVLAVRDREFVDAARLAGASGPAIMFRHLLPNAVFPVLVIATMEMGSTVVTAAFMSFVGLGAPKGYADWGQMVALARNYIVGPPDDPFRFWHTVLIPGGCIVLFVLAWNLLGDALRDALDPRLRRE
jgi:peptide/nickel transport system permease protein